MGRPFRLVVPAIRGIHELLTLLLELELELCCSFNWTTGHSYLPVKIHYHIGGRTYITIATKNRASMQKWFQIITEAAKPAEVSPKVDRKTGGKKVKNLADFRQTSFSELRSSSGLSSSRKLIFRGEDPMSVKYMSDGEEDDYFGGDSSELERYADETEEFCDENMGEGEAEEMEPGLWGGFLWIKKNNSSYKKYYCLANSHYFEIFFYTVGVSVLSALSAL